jgi:hypothetical protein
LDLLKKATNISVGPSAGGNLNPVPLECEAVVLPLDRDVLVSIILLGRGNVPGQVNQIVSCSIDEILPAIEVSDKHINFYRRK